MSYKEIRYNRITLYEEVWSEPMTKLAKKHNLSDNGLRKICRKLNIPFPPLGYWAKKQHGKKVTQKPLPPREEGDELVVTRWIKELPPVDKTQDSEAQEKIEIARNPENKIKVHPKLSSPHPLVIQAKDLLSAKKPNGIGFISSTGEKCLDLAISPNIYNRAMRILDALIKTMETYGFSVLVEKKSRNDSSTYYKTTATILGEELGFCLIEKTRREEKIEKRTYGTWKTYEHLPSGVLSVGLNEYIGHGARKSWTDGKIRKLEDRMNEVLIGMMKTAVIKRAERTERERMDKVYEERKRQREEKIRLIEEEKSKLVSLKENTDAWHHSNDIRKYIQAVSDDALAKDGDVGSELEEWINWAHQQADRNDPLKESPHSILDEEKDRPCK